MSNVESRKEHKSPLNHRIIALSFCIKLENYKLSSDSRFSVAQVLAVSKLTVLVNLIATTEVNVYQLRSLTVVIASRAGQE